MNGFDEIRIKSFLKESGMSPAPEAEEDPAGCALRIAEELKDCALKKNSSFAMLPSGIRAEALPDRLPPTLAVDIGGTNTRLVLIEGSLKDGLSERDLKVFETPGRRGTISAERFFDEIGDMIAPYECERIGVCFSFVAEILPDGDGRVVALSKEVDVKGCEGLVIGREINKRLASRGKAPVRVTVINDSCAAFLGAGARYGRIPDASFILGTGYNNCYCEPLLGGMLVNTESGRYTGFPLGDYDRAADRGSAYQGDFLAEKMISGEYLGAAIACAALGACEKGLMSPAFAGFVSESGLPGTSAISAFLSGAESPLRDALPEEDRKVFAFIARELLRRSALYAAVLTSACVIRRQPEPGKKILIAAEGSTYMKTGLLRTLTDRYIDEISNTVLGMPCEILSAEGTVLGGTAIGANMI